MTVTTIHHIRIMFTWLFVQIHHTKYVEQVLVRRYQYKISSAEFICYGKQKIASLYVQRLLYCGRLLNGCMTLLIAELFLIWPLFESLEKINNDNRKRKTAFTDTRYDWFIKLIINYYGTGKKINAGDDFTLKKTPEGFLFEFSLS